MTTNNDYQWPRVTVVICTYDRAVEFYKTIRALKRNIAYPNLDFLIADDGSKDDVLDSMVEDLALAFDFEDDKPVQVTQTDRKGWGANVNYALSQVETDYVFFIEDDHVLLKPLDLRPYVALLGTYHQIGMVRFGISGHDGIRATLREYDIPEDILPGYTEAHGLGSTHPGKLNAWELHLGKYASWGPYGFYRYSNRPHLKHRRFHDAYGYYAEGLPLATTEEEFNLRITAAHQRNERQHTVGGNGPVLPSIVVPCEWTYWHFDHIGKSRQGTEEDVSNG